MTQVQFREYAASGNIEMVQKGLLQKSIDPEKKNKQGTSALDAVINAPGHQNDHTLDQLKVIELLLKAGVSTNYNQYSTLTLYGHLDALKIMYKYNPRRVGTRELTSCVYNRHVETVKYVLENSNRDFSDYDLLGMISGSGSSIKWMKFDMFNLVYGYITNPSVDDNKYMLKVIESVTNQEIIDLITCDEKVITKALELGQQELYPKTVKDVFFL